MTELQDPGCAALYFDGVRARASTVRLLVVGGRLELQCDEPRSIALADVQWPEPTRHGALILRFADGGSVQIEDRGGFARLTAAAGVRESLVARAQNRWSLALGAVALLVVIAVLLVTLGVPLFSGWLARHTPPALEISLRDAALALLEDRYLTSSRLSEARQEEIRDELIGLLRRAGAEPAPLAVVFRGSRIGPNALTLPGDTIILTDDLIELAPDHDGVFGVFAHEYGHVRLKHGLRGLYESLSLTVLAGAVLGDYGSFSAAAPVILVTLAYSRAREHEADLEALHLMQAAGLDPEAMARMFEALAAARGGSGHPAPPIAFSTHPADAERVTLFRSAARPR